MKRILLMTALLLNISVAFAHPGHGCHKDVSDDIPHCQ